MYRGVYTALLLCLVGCDGKKTEGATAPSPGKTASPAALKDAPPARPAKKVALIREAAGEEGAKALLKRFLEAGADHTALSRALRPRLEDYAKVYGSEAASKMDATYGPAWDADQIRVMPKPGQTELLLWGATSAELKSGGGHAGQFPGGYSKVRDALQPDVRLYRFKFVEPGKTSGMAFDGLVHVGRWVLIPKPWRALR